MYFLTKAPDRQTDILQHSCSMAARSPDCAESDRIFDSGRQPHCWGGSQLQQWHLCAGQFVRARVAQLTNNPSVVQSRLAWLVRSTLHLLCRKPRRQLEIMYLQRYMDRTKTLLLISRQGMNALPCISLIPQAPHTPFSVHILILPAF